MTQLENQWLLNNPLTAHVLYYENVLNFDCWVSAISSKINKDIVMFTTKR